jgi:hypothetical protein
MRIKVAYLSYLFHIQRILRLVFYGIVLFVSGKLSFAVAAAGCVPLFASVVSLKGHTDISIKVQRNTTAVTL